MTKQAKFTLRRQWVFLVMFVLVGSNALAKSRYYGADSRGLGDLGGYEGSIQSGHYSHRLGFHSYPGHWFEGRGPNSDHGHAGDTRRYGRYSNPPGHSRAAYLPQRHFEQRAHGNPCRGLFLYR